MTAPLWSRALQRGLYPAARVCRLSQSTLGLHALRAGRLSSLRYASSAAQLAEPYSAVEPVFDATEVPPKVAEKPLAHSDQPKFETLEGSVSARSLKALTDDPFKMVHMSSVQAAVLPLLPRLVQPNVDGEQKGRRDLMVKARTGTGKTLAFLVPAVEARLNALRAHAEEAAKNAMTNNKTMIMRAVQKYARTNVGALIISPTRELATQIANEAIKLTKHHDQFEVRLFVGGLPKRAQLREWHTGRRDIVVATTGRLRDFIENEPGFADDLKTTDMFILDEADTLLEMGFREDIRAIEDIIKPPSERQTFMFSATLSKQIQLVAKSVLAPDHTFINCVPDNAAPTHLQIPQYYTAVPTPEEQLPHVIRLLAEDQLTNPGKSKVLVFLPTTRMVKLYSALVDRVSKNVLPAGMRTRFYEMHSQKNMHSRVSTSDTFRRDKSGSAIMFTSDVSARGVDYPGVTRVIQVGTPSNGDIYVHRVGRTGRGSNMSGRADLVLLPWELGFLSWQLTDIPIKELPINQLKEQVTALAQKHDANPTAFFPAEENSQRRTGARDYSRPSFPSDVAGRLEQIQERVTQLQAFLSEEDVQDAMSTMLAFYASHAGTLRVQRNVTVAGVQTWAEALLGRKTQLRVPREFVPRERQAVNYKRSESDFRRSRDRDSDQDSRGYRRDTRDGGYRRDSRDGESRRGWNRDSEEYGRRDSNSRQGSFSREFDGEADDRSSHRSSHSRPRWGGRGQQNSR